MTVCAPATSAFAEHVIEGLGRKTGKYLSAKYFYDDLGSKLFEAITLLPEYGLTRADERLLELCAHPLLGHTGPLASVIELGSGDGHKSASILRAALEVNPGVIYQPIDVSSGALAVCQGLLEPVCKTEVMCEEWLPGLKKIARMRAADSLPVLVMFLGSTVGNLERDRLVEFFTDIRLYLRNGDYLLLGADLVKDVDTMIDAYADPTGVTAAFNLNVLGRINRDLQANIDLRSFSHEVRWNAGMRRIEMHLVSRRRQTAEIKAAGLMVHFEAGETIWTESSHKFDVRELEALAVDSGYEPLDRWIDKQWPMAEVLWKVTK